MIQKKEEQEISQQSQIKNKKRNCKENNVKELENYHMNESRSSQIFMHVQVEIITTRCFFFVFLLFHCLRN